jgi:hypothetical protein
MNADQRSNEQQSLQQQQKKQSFFSKLKSVFKKKDKGSKTEAPKSAQDDRGDYVRVGEPYAQDAHDCQIQTHCFFELILGFRKESEYEKLGKKSSNKKQPSMRKTDERNSRDLNKEGRQDMTKQQQLHDQQQKERDMMSSSDLDSREPLPPFRYSDEVRKSMGG